MVRNSSSEIEKQYLLGVEFESVKRYDDAMQYFQSALSLDSSHGQSLYHIGLILSELGNYDRALEYFHKSIISGEDSGINPVDYLMATTDTMINLPFGIKQDKVAKALKIIDGFLNHEGNNVEMLRVKARTLDAMFDATGKRRDIEAAISCYDKILANSQDDTNAIESKADALVLLGKRNEAIALYEEALGIYDKLTKDDSNSAILESKGDNLSKRGKRREAHDCYEKAIKAAKEDISLMYNKDGTESEAYSVPKHYEYFLIIARILDKLGKKFESKQYYLSADMVALSYNPQE